MKKSYSVSRITPLNAPVKHRKRGTWGRGIGRARGGGAWGEGIRKD